MTKIIEWYLLNSSLFWGIYGLLGLSFCLLMWRLGFPKEITSFFSGSRLLVNALFHTHENDPSILVPLIIFIAFWPIYFALDILFFLITNTACYILYYIFRLVISLSRSIRTPAH